MDIKRSTQSYFCHINKKKTLLLLVYGLTYFICTFCIYYELRLMYGKTHFSRTQLFVHFIYKIDTTRAVSPQVECNFVVYNFCK